jgi:hypothetical protein
MKAPRSNTKEFEKCPKGWQLGVCSRVIDKGTHWIPDKHAPAQGKFQRKISIVFESQHLMKEGDFVGEPFLLYANFNYSMFQGKAFLCNFIEDWRGRRFHSQEEAEAFDLAKLIGQKAFMNVVYDGAFTNIQTIGPVPDGMIAPEIKGKTILIDQDNLDMVEVEKLSDKMKEAVMSAEERKPENQATGQQGSMENIPPSENPGAGMTPADADFDDDIPF